jgi:hypothetical protein
MTEGFFKVREALFPANVFVVGFQGRNSVHRRTVASCAGLRKGAGFPHRFMGSVLGRLSSPIIALANAADWMCLIRSSPDKFGGCHLCVPFMIPGIFFSRELICLSFLYPIPIIDMVNYIVRVIWV